MEIKGRVLCLFEQSGTFKRAFRDRGVPAEDYDIQNEFGETDHVVDLFDEIERGYNDEPSIFDDVTSDDLMLAFFPCIYFCVMSQILMTWGGYTKNDYKHRTEKVLKRGKNREYFWSLLVKLFTIAKVRGLRLVVENPWSGNTFLKHYFIVPPTFIDEDRSLRGDVFRKPTAYWFVNCDPTFGMSYERPAEVKTVREAAGASVAGVCSTERSMITDAYARNWISDFIFGIEKSDMGFVSQGVLF